MGNSNWICFSFSSSLFLVGKRSQKGGRGSWTWEDCKVSVLEFITWNSQIINKMWKNNTAFPSPRSSVKLYDILFPVLDGLAHTVSPSQIVIVLNLFAWYSHGVSALPYLSWSMQTSFLIFMTSQSKCNFLRDTAFSDHHVHKSGYVQNPSQPYSH